MCEPERRILPPASLDDVRPALDDFFVPGERFLAMAWGSLMTGRPALPCVRSVIAPLR